MYNTTHTQDITDVMGADANASAGILTPGYTVNNDSGGSITFANGVTVSVQFGIGNYCHRAIVHKPYLYNIKSTDAEIAIWNDCGKWITQECPVTKGYDDVHGYVTPYELVDILIWARNL